MEKPVITVFKGLNSWMATFHGDVLIRQAFGTDTIPTPFTLQADAETVRQAVQKRNPSHVVTVRG